MDCEIINALFLPNFLDITVTIGMTKNVVTRAPTLPKSVGQIQAPSFPVTPSKR